MEPGISAASSDWIVENMLKRRNKRMIDLKTLHTCTSLLEASHGQNIAIQTNCNETSNKSECRQMAYSTSRWCGRN
ncbi:hypothetical protein GOBAR_DD07341 [Gossypium barbadense]|nr:hypothetical protein GOBAR_DD07341 [Gossypium barbadense]